VPFNHKRLRDTYRQVRESLLAARSERGHWEGELSTSALSTATAVMALEMVRRSASVRDSAGPSAANRSPAVIGTPDLNTSVGSIAPNELRALISRGIEWLAAHQNTDGGWGDTTRSFSNIATTMLCHAVFHATQEAERFANVVARASTYIETAGGIRALRARYGTDKTFSIPILTHCALAGLVLWHEVSPLPFELACIPPEFYKWARLPVVSYALPALIAIGQVRHHFVKPKNPLVRFVRNRAINRSLAILEQIQPSSGGFLEAAPLTSFVTMSLAGMGRSDHPVVQRGVDFLVKSVRPDGSWPIDSNLATWVTTLSINALGDDLPAATRPALRDWLLGQQFREVHPYTKAAPGGWAWTDLPGGVPDADDTPGAMLALVQLDQPPETLSETAGVESIGPIGPIRPIAETDLQKDAVGSSAPAPSQPAEISSALEQAVDWLLGLQNSDGGWPTFCRGWGKLPFDRSAPDLTAHAIRALGLWTERGFMAALSGTGENSLDRSIRRGRLISRAINRGFQYLNKSQRADGSWLPLWFGNQHASDDENPTYGTARVLAAYLEAGLAADPACVKGLDWLRRSQNHDGGWGGAPTIISTTEETALALDVLISLETDLESLSDGASRGLNWLLERFDQGKLMEPSPIGFYFAKLWYFERLYPLIFATAVLRRTVELAPGPQTG
jgi:squalene-hopene/tetraprenyl-beta-curcumene cyclase